MKYPITQQDIDDAIERLKGVPYKPQKAGTKPKSEPTKKVGKTTSKVATQRSVRVLREMKQLPILPLDEATKRLNDDEVYRQASKGWGWYKD